jgi:hypothetical protein
MNYKHIYDALCQKSQIRFNYFYSRTRSLRNLKGIIYNETNFKYLELHHIIPVCDGGSNCIENLVFFTAKEHIIAHHLLYKAIPTRQHAQAWHYQAHSPKSGYKIRITPKEFEELRIINANNSRLIAAKSNETMRRTGQRFGKGNAMYGRKWYTNTVINITLKETDEIPEGFVRGRTDVVQKDKRMSTKGYYWYNDGIKNKMFKTDNEIPENFKKGMLR